MLLAGRVGRPHGLDGSFYVNEARVPLLAVGALIVVAGRERRVVRHAGTERHPILGLDGVKDRESAEEIRGQELTVPSDRAPALGAGEWWAHDLEGCAVVDGAQPVGSVGRMLELPSCEVLEVLRAGREPLLVPMVADAIRAIDLDRQQIDIDLQFLDSP
jgi:16S rRNA processing protein RimM